MQLKILLPLSAEARHPGVRPDVGAVTPVTTEFDVVHMGYAAVLENHDQLVLGPIQRSHACVALGPDADVPPNLHSDAVAHQEHKCLDILKNRKQNQNKHSI